MELDQKNEQIFTPENTDDGWIFRFLIICLIF